MTLSFDIPDDVECALRLQLGPSLEDCAKRDLAATWFREGRITSRQVASFLGMSVFEAHNFLKQKGASLPMSLNDVKADLASLRELRGP